jgi:hypothetical protein
MKHPINMPPLPGDTPSELIDLQHDTWAYELKVWAEERQAKSVSRKPRYWAVIALCGIVVMLLSCSKQQSGKCFTCHTGTQGAQPDTTVCGYPSAIEANKAIKYNNYYGTVGYDCQENP